MPTKTLIPAPTRAIAIFKKAELERAHVPPVPEIELMTVRKVWNMSVASRRAAETFALLGLAGQPFVATALFGLGLVLLVACLLTALSLSDFGHLTRHMAAHIVITNVAAPLTAILLFRCGQVRSASSAELSSATALQIALLWGWHSPIGLSASHGSPTLQLVAYASLFLSAFLFWLAVLSQANAARWRAIAALLLTGKLYCLLGALLTFAPRPLFSLHTPAPLHGGAGESALADQQLAGLMMLSACPATYVLAGVVIAAFWLNELVAEAR